MSLVKLNNRFPLIDTMFGDLWNSDRLFHDDFMVKNQCFNGIGMSNTEQS